MRAQPASILARPDDAARVPNFIRQSHRTRKAAGIPLQMSHHRRQRRPVVGSPRQRVFLIFWRVRRAREHPIAARGVGIVVGGHRPQHGDPVGESRRLRHQLAHVQPGRGGCDRLKGAADLLGSIRLGVPGFMLRWATEHKEHDHPLCFAKASDAFHGGRGRSGPHHRRGCSNAAEQADPQPLPAGQAVAQPRACMLKAQHSTPPVQQTTPGSRRRPKQCPGMTPKAVTAAAPRAHTAAGRQTLCGSSADA